MDAQSHVLRGRQCFLTPTLQLLIDAKPVGDLPMAGQAIILVKRVDRRARHADCLARGRKAFEGTVDEARATSPRYLEVEGAVDPTAIAALPGVAGIDQLEYDGELRNIRVRLAANADVQQTLRTAFMSNLDLRRFQLKEPSLHDAFIALTGDNPDDDQRQQGLEGAVKEAGR